MFRENNDHLQDNLFNSLYGMDQRLAQKLQNSWAALFYEHVFCKIDENLFAPLYSNDNGRPNFPVNIFMGLDLIKEIREYTDEVLLDEYAFNYQISYALGLRTLGERYFAPRTLYEFRARLYQYSLEHPEEADLIYAQFEKLTDHFIAVTGLNTDEARMDSTQIMSNIKLAGRLSLAYDVLVNAIKALPEHLRTDALKVFLKADYKTHFLYQLKKQDTLSRIQGLIDHGAELLQQAEKHTELKSITEIQLLDRFLREQAVFNPEENRWLAKNAKEISSKSLQSAYDADATYRNKNGKKHVGYALNLSETCADDNAVQIVTHYDLAPNTTSDIELLKRALPNLSEHGIKDVYTDGGYYSPDMAEKAQAQGVTVHFTDMTGRKKSNEKLPYSEFEIENKQKILRCPAQYTPLRTAFDDKKKILSAHFDRQVCDQCPKKEICRVKFQKKDTVLRVSQKALRVEETRLKIENQELRREATSKRAAIEGTNSALKRARGVNKLRVRGIIKSKLVIGAKIIAHNFLRLAKFLRGYDRRKARRSSQGIPVSV
ncbi:transposase [Desulfitobacterium sp.]|uniref:transposase n=1 Tax=Desulfitobacterium sp. TaxID=49981 RepID=UPI002B1FA074|nr:transposase [Desulfitobacterium sp.]MEA4903177.1 transposase [Desulfitobacterium sp.]